MMFSNQIREHNGAVYKMQILESIYNSKKNSRPKDKYDANIRLDTEKQDNYDINHQIAINSIVQKIENAMKKTINKQR